MTVKAKRISAGLYHVLINNTYTGLNLEEVWKPERAIDGTRWNIVTADSMAQGNNYLVGAKTIQHAVDLISKIGLAYTKSAGANSQQVELQ